MENKKESTKAIKGIILMILASVLTAFGQLSWKFFQTEGLIFLFIGFLLYGLGAVIMMLAFKNGELSVLYPLMCTGYIIALINGKIFLNESVSVTQYIGITVIMIGIVFMGIGGKK